MQSLDLAPRVNQLDATSFKISNVARRNSSRISHRNRSNLTIELADRSSHPTPYSSNGSEGASSSAIKRQNSTTKILLKNSLDNLGERITSPARRQNFHTVPKLGLTDGREIDHRTILRS